MQAVFTKRHTLALLTVLVCTAVGRETAAQEKLLPPSPDLRLRVEDDFREDSLGDYSISGPVTWRPGQVLLGPGGALKRSARGGAAIRVETRFHASETGEKSPSEIQLRFSFEGATDCILRVRTAGEDRAGSVALLDTDGRGGTELVREGAWRARPERGFRVEYRHGLMMFEDGTHTFLAYVANGSAAIEAVAIRAPGQRLTSLKVLGNDRRGLTDDQLKNLATAEDLTGQFRANYRRGDYATAVTQRERVLAIEEDILGAAQSAVALSLNDLGLTYEKLGQPDVALARYQRALPICAASVSARHPTYATILSNLARLHTRQGRATTAEPIFREALQIRRSVLGPEHPTTASSLNDLGTVCVTLAKYAEAERLLLQNVAIHSAVRQTDPIGYATSLNNLASVYAETGDYAKASTRLEEATKLWKEVAGNNDRRYAISVSNLAAVSLKTGDYAQAEALAQEAVEIQERLHGRNSIACTDALAELASTYQATGDRAKSIALFRESIRIRESLLGNEHVGNARLYFNLGALYAQLGQAEEAESLLTRARDIWEAALGSRHPNYSRAINKLGTLHSRAGDFDRGEALLREAVKIRLDVHGAQHPLYATSLNDLGALCCRRGDYEEAISYLAEAAEITRRALGERHPFYAARLSNLANARMNLGQTAEAEKLLRQSLEITGSVMGRSHRSYGVRLNILGTLFFRRGDHEAAATHFRQAGRIVRGVLDRTAVVQSERHQKGNQSRDRFLLDWQLSNAIHTGAASVEALESMWRWKGAVTAQQKAYRQAANDSRIAPAFGRLQTVSRRLSALMQRIPSPPPETGPERVARQYTTQREKWQEDFTRLTRERESIEEQIAADSAAFRQWREPLTIAQVQDRLPNGTALVDFLAYNHIRPDPETAGRVIRERRYLAFIVRRDHPVQLVGLGQLSQVTQAIDRFRARLHKEPTLLAGTAGRAAQELRGALWKPLEPHLAGVDTVILSPDGELGLLPFAALPGETPGQFLIEDYRIATVPLAAMLRPEALDDSREAERGLLVLGDVDYDAPTDSDGQPASRPSRPWMRRSAPTSGSDWPALPGFQAELAVVRDRFERQFDAEVTLLRRQGATESEFLRQAPRHYNLHIVTHGFFAGEDLRSIAREPAESSHMVALDDEAADLAARYQPGLLTGLVLAGANQRPSTDDPTADGILTATEIETLDLNAVDLVVLSACETGLGKVADGEGLTGLQRAFHVAGANSCIASLWKVDDEATLRLMRHFYRNYWEHGQSRIDALRNAQLLLLRDPEQVRGESRNLKPAADQPAAQRTAPYYWAAFQLSGDWQ